MLNQSSKEFRTLFLLQFTKELIKSKIPNEVFELKNVLEQDEKRKKQVKLLRSSKIISLKQKPKKKNLKIPKIKIPPHLQYLKPNPIKESEIDLGKLNIFLKDPMIKDIECNGANEEIILRGTKGTKKINMILTKEEIDTIITNFSTLSKIPIEEGLYKVTVGRIVFSAIISRITGSRFIIKKMNYNPNFN